MKSGHPGNTVRLFMFIIMAYDQLITWMKHSSKLLSFKKVAALYMCECIVAHLIISGPPHDFEVLVIYIQSTKRYVT